MMALAQALESQDHALIHREESEAYQKQLNAGVDYALVTLMPSFLSETEANCTLPIPVVQRGFHYFSWLYCPTLGDCKS